MRMPCLLAAEGDGDGVLGAGDGLDLDRSGGSGERAGSPVTLPLVTTPVLGW